MAAAMASSSCSSNHSRVNERNARLPSSLMTTETPMHGTSKSSRLTNTFPRWSSCRCDSFSARVLASVAILAIRSAATSSALADWREEHPANVTPRARMRMQRSMRTLGSHNRVMDDNLSSMKEKSRHNTQQFAKKKPRCQRGGVRGPSVKPWYA